MNDVIANPEGFRIVGMEDNECPWCLRWGRVCVLELDRQSMGLICGQCLDLGFAVDDELKDYCYWCWSWGRVCIVNGMGENSFCRQCTRLITYPDARTAPQCPPWQPDARGRLMSALEDKGWPDNVAQRIASMVCPWWEA